MFGPSPTTDGLVLPLYPTHVQPDSGEFEWMEARAPESSFGVAT